MIQFPNLNKGILIYAQNTTDDPDLGKIIELRVDNEFNYQYQARYFGIYCPTYKLSFGDVDRLLIKLPAIESDVVYPVYLERVRATNMYYENDFVYFYENLRNPQKLIPQDGAVYAIDTKGFRFVSGKVKLDHETLPAKVKLHIPDITSHGKFHLYNPDTGNLLWTIEVDGLDISINDTAIVTLENESEIEMDIGFSSESLTLNFFESDELLYTTTHSSALDTPSEASGSILEFEGLNNLTVDWLLCYKASPKNSSVYAVLEYTDFETLVTSGQPTLTHITRFGIKGKMNKKTTVECGIERTTTESTLASYGMRVAKRDVYSYTNPVELLVYNTLSCIHPVEIKIHQNHVYTNPVLLSVGSAITTTDTCGLKGTKADQTDDALMGIKGVKHNYILQSLGIQRQVALQENYYWGMQPTHIKDVFEYGKLAMTIRKESPLIDAEKLLIMIAKIMYNINIDRDCYEKYKVLSTFSGGGIESE